MPRLAKKKTKPKKGPKPDYLKVDGNWVDAVNNAVKKKRPKDGWPDKEKKE